MDVIAELSGIAIDPSKRLFWGFLASSAVLIVATWFLQQKKMTWRRICATFFAREYWLTRSTLVDVSFLGLNTFLRTVLLVPLFGSHLVGALWVGRSLQGQFGTMPELQLPVWLIGIAYTLVFFIVEDLSRFSLHRLMHRVPLLWGFHRTHHSAEILTPLTLNRVHPVEMSLYFLRGLIVFSLVSGAFIYVAGSKLTALEILGVDALGFLFNFLGANLRHSHIWLSFGPFERWFISPAQHQIHHSADIQHRDKNFGTCLACWDKWFGSWVKAGSRRRFRFGLLKN